MSLPFAISLPLSYFSSPPHWSAKSKERRANVWHNNRFQFSFPLLSLTIPIEIEAWNTFNSVGQISQYDATFRYWQWTMDYLLEAAGKRFGTNSTAATVVALQDLLAQSICQTEEESCKDGNKQYKSKAECLDFLTNKIRFGAEYELGMSPPRCFILSSE